MWNQTDPVKHSALVPRATEKDRDTQRPLGETKQGDAARERPSHLVALGPHTRRDTNSEARRRWPQSCEGATPCDAGLVSEPSSRGQGGVRVCVKVQPHVMLV